TLITLSQEEGFAEPSYEKRWVLRRWRWGTGEMLGKPVVADGKVNSVPKAFVSPDGRLLVTTGYDGPAFLHDAQTGKRLREIKNGRDGTITPNGKQLVLTTERGGLGVFDSATGKHLCQLAPDRPGTGRFMGGFYYPTVSPDGRMVAALDYGVLSL